MKRVAILFFTLVLTVSSMNTAVWARGKLENGHKITEKGLSLGKQCNEKNLSTAKNKKTSGEILKQFGIIKGTGRGLEENKILTRAEMMTLLSRLYKVETSAKNFKPAFGKNRFSDVKEGDWYYGYVEYAAIRGWTNGYPDGSFKPNRALSAQEVDMLLLRVLGYDEKWENAIFKAKELGMQVNVSNFYSVKRKEIFDAIVRAFEVKMGSSKKVLVDYLGLKEPYVINSNIKCIMHPDQADYDNVAIIYGLNPSMAYEYKNNNTSKWRDLKLNADTGQTNLKLIKENYEDEAAKKTYKLSLRVKGDEIHKPSKILDLTIKKNKGEWLKERDFYALFNIKTGKADIYYKGKEKSKIDSYKIKGDDKEQATYRNNKDNIIASVTDLSRDITISSNVTNNYEKSSIELNLEQLPESKFHFSELIKYDRNNGSISAPKGYVLMESFPDDNNWEAIDSYELYEKGVLKENIDYEFPYFRLVPKHKNIFKNASDVYAQLHIVVDDGYKDAFKLNVKDGKITTKLAAKGYPKGSKDRDMPTWINNIAIKSNISGIVNDKESNYILKDNKGHKWQVKRRSTTDDMLVTVDGKPINIEPNTEYTVVVRHGALLKYEEGKKTEVAFWQHNRDSFIPAMNTNDIGRADEIKDGTWTVDGYGKHKDHKYVIYNNDIVETSKKLKSVEVSYDGGFNYQPLEWEKDSSKKYDANSSGGFFFLKDTLYKPNQKIFIRAAGSRNKLPSKPVELKVK